MSYPEGGIQSSSCEPSASGERPAETQTGRQRAEVAGFGRCQSRFQAVRRLDGGQHTQRSRPSNRLRPVVDGELAVDIAGMDLDRMQREVEPGRNLLIGQPFRDVVEHFKLAFA